MHAPSLVAHASRAHPYAYTRPKGLMEAAWVPKKKFTLTNNSELQPQQLPQAAACIQGMHAMPCCSSHSQNPKADAAACKRTARMRSSLLTRPKSWAKMLQNQPTRRALALGRKTDECLQGLNLPRITITIVSAAALSTGGILQPFPSRGPQGQSQGLDSGRVG